MVHSFNWTTFMHERASLPCGSDLIGTSIQHLNKSIGEVLFRKDTPVLVGGGEVEPIPAIIHSVVGQTAFVHFLGDKTLEEVKLDQLMLALSPYTTSIYAHDNLFNLRNFDAAKLQHQVGCAVKIGAFFELIDELNPTIVHTVKIVGHNNGFVRTVSEAGVERCVFISSERCRRIGWSLLPRNEGHFTLRSFLGTTVSTTVPFYVFNQPLLIEHQLERFQILEMIDPLTRFRIIPAVVSDIRNKYYFCVTPLYGPGGPRPTPVTCHRGSPDLLPGNWCSRNGMRLSVPKGYETRAKFVPESYFDFPRPEIETMRHVEIFDTLNRIMIPATILRMHRHLLVVRLENNRQFTSPKLYAYFDERIFAPGTAERCGIPFCRMPDTIDCSQWHFKSPKGLVTKPEQHCPGQQRRFMLRAFANDAQYTPRLYINFACYKGPFISEETMRFVDRSIPPSPLVPAIQHVLQQLCENVLRKDTQKHFSASTFTAAPTFAVKLSNPRNDKRSRIVNIEVCESAEQFPGWLRQFLLQFDVCPNFISPVKRLPDEPCPMRCHCIDEEQPQLRIDAHVNASAARVVAAEDIQRIRRPGEKSLHTPANVVTSEQPSVKRVRADPIIQEGLTRDEKASSNDLDEPLSTRRTRRNIVRSRRHEIVHDNETTWRRRADAAAATSGSQMPESTKTSRESSAEMDETSMSAEAIEAMAVQLAEERPTIHTYAWRMAAKVDTLLHNSFAEMPSIANRQDAMRAAVRRGNGPLLLFPQHIPPRPDATPTPSAGASVERDENDDNQQPSASSIGATHAHRESSMPALTREQRSSLSPS